MEGKYDAEAGTLTMMSQGIDPQSGKSTDQKSVSRWLDDGTRQFEMYVKTSEAGEFVKVMEVRYKRRK